MIYKKGSVASHIVNKQATKDEYSLPDPSAGINFLSVDTFNLKFELARRTSTLLSQLRKLPIRSTPRVA